MDRDLRKDDICEIRTEPTRRKAQDFRSPLREHIVGITFVSIEMHRSLRILAGAMS